MNPKVLIANRGVIARRILRSIHKLGWQSVLVYSEADADCPAVREATESVLLGPPAPAASYLDSAKILNIARHSGCSIIHPGYGFLSENADFCEACEAEGVRFAGPTSEQIRLFGLKNTAREAAKQCGLPLLPGSDLLETVEEAVAAAEGIGFPVILKSTAGGGGIGMRVCHHEADLRDAYESVRRLGEANFRHGGVFLEKFVTRARHIEVQIFGDGIGNVVALGERDCSVQRRNQKVIEEAPALDLPESVRSELHACAVRLGQSVSYRSAGTVEFLYDASEEKFYFLEVNTRLQVEHGVTEEVFGLDLVEWMLRLANGETSFLDGWTSGPKGHSIQARIYAEIPAKDFQPSTGLVTRAAFDASIRNETWIEAGVEVTSYYDPMLAKLIATAPTRAEALAKLGTALEKTHIDGLETNLKFVAAVLESDDFRRGAVCTNFLGGFSFVPALIEVLDAGVETLLVDWPGRVGYWDVGVPPSGPFDDQSFRLANLKVGNPEGTVGLECTVRGPTLRFLSDSLCCLAGAEMNASLDGQPIGNGEAFTVHRGQVLRMGTAHGPGMRTYLAIKGGLDVPDVLGSKTTFRLGQFGGHGGRALRTGDFLRLNLVWSGESRKGVPASPDLGWGNEWSVDVSYGPHAAPDFFTPEFIEKFFATSWEVHYNSARTGVRLIGPKPGWARPDGGEAGLHPSNIHDNAYQVGAIDFTGDMPIILGPDGPSLGGFVCPATVLSSELWKVGQMRPGDRVRFRPVPLPQQESKISHPSRQERLLEPIVLWENGDVVIRRQGDTGFLVEFGEMVLDLALRFRVQALYESLRAAKPEGMLDLTPGIRSLQVRYDAKLLPLSKCLDFVVAAIQSMPSMEGLVIPTRIVHLPLSWDDPATRLAIEKYMQSVRPDAPWCPSNLEFIRRINGLPSIEHVKQIVFNASYLVLGLGDVYLGAPVATPIDPRHRLVTTKYNPARTWTPENAVGIGGAYMCIYGMEGPGGYQFVGRTVPIWNRFRSTKSFQAGFPWLLRLFDQIRFYEVSAGELLDLRKKILTGQFEPRIETGEFSFAEYKEFLRSEASSISDFQTMQRRAFAEERQRWSERGHDLGDEVEPQTESTNSELFQGETAVCSPAAGIVWKLLIAPGQEVHEGQTVAILESMKMEINCIATANGIVSRILVEEGKPVSPGQNLVTLRS